MTTVPGSARTYGGWRRPASPGLGSLALLPTAILFGGSMLSILVGLTRGIVDALTTAAVFLAVLLPLVVRVADRPAWREVALRVAWWHARRTGGVLYRSGPMSTTDVDGFRLPGLLADTRMWRARDAYSREFALIEHPHTDQWTVVLAVNPNAGALISGEERDVRVAHWDRWLAGLGREPGIDQVAVVLDQVPDPGRLLRAAVETGLDPQAPAFALAVMRDAARHLPTGGAEITAHVAVTFGGRALHVTGPETGDRRRDAEPGRAAERAVEQAAERAAAEIGTRLPGLSRTLVSTGSGEGRPLTPEQLATRVRGWFDPAVQVPLAEAEARGEDPGIDWEDAGPVAAQETWTGYRHDSGLSRTYEMVQPPRGAVFDAVLLPLTAPMTGVQRKRVTLLYRPLDAAGAPGALDRQVRAAVNRAGRRRDLVHAHDSAEVRAALQAAQEEATGAGVVTFSVLVTVTVESEPELRQAGETITRAGRQAQLRLRPLHGAQAAAFAVGLGVGVVPGNHSVVPAGLRESS
jgi:hypothetical protein